MPIKKKPFVRYNEEPKDVRGWGYLNKKDIVRGAGEK